MPIFRVEPNTPVEVRRGVLCYAPAPDVDRGLEQQVLELFARLGRVVTVPEELLGAAASVTAVGPAYMALVAEAQIDAAVRHGLKPGLAGVLAAETMGGTAALLAHRDYDTLDRPARGHLPRGVTARGLPLEDESANANPLPPSAGQPVSHHRRLVR